MLGLYLRSLGRRHGQAGFSLVAAILASTVVALLATQALTVERGHTRVADARVTQARLLAATDAGLALAAQALAHPEPGRRWPTSPEPRVIPFDGMSLAIRIEDERGKISLNYAPVGVMRRLLSQLGYSGEQLDRLADTFEDWRDTDNFASPRGAEEREYAAAGGGVLRDSPLRSLWELAEVMGWDGAVVDRVAPYVTVHHTEADHFRDALAGKLALSAMRDEGFGEASGLSQNTNRAPRQPRETRPPERDRLRPYLVTVTAEAPDGSRFERRAVLTATGIAADPIWVRAYE